MSILNVNLPKWPAIVVRGETVTADQAAEIIVRTHGYIFSNDKGWESLVRKILGYPSREGSHYDDGTEARRRLGVIELEYLHNNQIASAWVGGSDDGWIKWDGRVENSPGKNIGKWPSASDVRDEWRLIAKTFPFLNLKCELWNCEAGELMDDDEPKSVVGFSVADGRVMTYRPKKPVAQRSNGSWIIGGSERGCDAETLLRAVEIVKKSMAGAS